MRSIILKSAAALALITGALSAIPAAAQDDAQLSVLHGVPGLTVDVCVNDTVLLPGFTPGTLTPPQSLPAGTYSVEIFVSTTDCSGTPAIAADLPLAAGMNYTAVAHLNATGTPTATLFTNDTSAAGAGEGKVTIRHTAANAEGVQILVNGSIDLGTFINGGTIGPQTLPVGTYSAEIKAGDVTVPPTPANVPVTEGQNTIVYAWGDAASGRVELAVQVVDLEASAPVVVPAKPVPTMGTIGIIALVTLMLGIGLLGVRRLV